MLRAYRYHLRTKLGGVVREARRLLLVVDYCTPATSLALLLLSKHHLPRMRHVLHSTVSILTAGGACSEILRVVREVCDTLVKAGLECTTTEKLALEQENSAKHPLLAGAVRLRAVLEALGGLEPKPIIALLPYAAEHLTQWYMGGLRWGPFWLPKLLHLLRERNVYIATPLAEHSMLDYAAYTYLSGFAITECSPCKLLDARFLRLQSRSPEYVFAALKLVEELRSLLTA